MLLKKLILKNFRQFRGEHSIEFSCDPEKNVTVIIGKNTRGKTTLVRAINWCLYGDKKGFNNQNLLNSELQKEMACNSQILVTVELLFEHKELDYTLKRTELYRKNDNGAVYFDESRAQLSYLSKSDGQTLTIPEYEIERSIDSILPQDLSSYFLYAGERVNSISETDDISSAVKGLLSLDVLEKSRNHLIKVKKEFEKGIDTGGDKNVATAKARLASIETELADIEANIADIQKDIEYYNDKLEDVKSQLRKNEESAEQQKRIDGLDRSIKEKELRYAEQVSVFRKKFCNNSFAYFGQNLIKKSIDIVGEYQDETVHTYQGVVDQTIYQIIETGVCLCGTKIKKGSQEEDYLRRQLNYVPPVSIASDLLGFKTKSEAYLESSEKYMDDLNNQYKLLREIHKDIEDEKRQRDVLVSKMTGHDRSAELHSEELDAKRKLAEKTEYLSRKNIEKGRLLREQEVNQKIIDSYLTVSEKNAKLNLYVNYVNELIERFGSSYSEREKEAQSQLNKKVQGYFKEMYHGDREIILDSNYHVRYLDSGIDESDGQRTVKNFSFVAGLVDMARNKIVPNENETLETVHESYPLILDAPFSSLDELHVTNISKVLPKVTDQLILVVMKKDWRCASEVVDEIVGKQYFLNRITERSTSIGIECTDVDDADEVTL